MDDEIDYDLALADIQDDLPATNAVRATLVAPDSVAWQEFLGLCGRAIPPQRAAALAGLQWRKVKAWMRMHPEQAERLAEVRAQVTAKLVGVVWDEAINEGNWKAALSLLRHTEPLYNPAPRKQKVEVSHTTNITAEKAQVIAGSSLEDLRRVLGR